MTYERTWHQDRRTLLVVMGALLTALLLPVAAQAQQNEARLLEEIRRAYRDLEYREAAEKARAAIEQHEGFRPDQLTEIHSILAFIAYAENDLDEAARQFESALQLTPDLELDPLLVSPKILAFFEEVRERRDSGGDARVGTPAIRYVVVVDRRAEAAPRSLALPGWGQRYKGETTKGWVITGLWSGVLVGAGAAHLQMTGARNAYHDPSITDLDLIEANYRDYNAWYKARNNLLVGAAGVWLFSYLDALILRLDDARTSNDRLRISGSPSHLSLSVTL